MLVVFGITPISLAKAPFFLASKIWHFMTKHDVFDGTILGTCDFGLFQGRFEFVNRIAIKDEVRQLVKLFKVGDREKLTLLTSFFESEPFGCGSGIGKA